MPTFLNHPEYQYLDLLENILNNGKDKPIFGIKDKTLRSVFGRQIRFDLSQGFPLLTTKKVFFKGIVHELLWLLKGTANIKYLIDNDVHIWDEWAYKQYTTELEKIGKSPLRYEDWYKACQADDVFARNHANLGNVYGVQWRHFRGHGDREADQIKWIVDGLKKTPERKSYIVSAWHPCYIYSMARPGESMALPPCHTLFQANVSEGKLSLQLYQRSADMFLGVPFNIASYSLLTHMLAQVTGLQVGDFVHTFGDAHIYSDHFDQCKQQVERIPKAFPKIRLNPEIDDIDDFTFEDIEILNYDPHPPIKGDITVVGGF